MMTPMMTLRTIVQGRFTHGSSRVNGKAPSTLPPGRRRQAAYLGE
jgi:hypothetical protein